MSRLFVSFEWCKSVLAGNGFLQMAKLSLLLKLVNLLK